MSLITYKKVISGARRFLNLLHMYMCVSVSVCEQQKKLRQQQVSILQLSTMGYKLFLNLLQIQYLTVPDFR